MTGSALSSPVVATTSSPPPPPPPVSPPPPSSSSSSPHATTPMAATSVSTPARNILRSCCKVPPRSLWAEHTPLTSFFLPRPSVPQTPLVVCSMLEFGDTHGTGVGHWTTRLEHCPDCDRNMVQPASYEPL